jgi:hypothetical protein
MNLLLRYSLNQQEVSTLSHYRLLQPELAWLLKKSLADNSREGEIKNGKYK